MIGDCYYFDPKLVTETMEKIREDPCITYIGWAEHDVADDCRWGTYHVYFDSNEDIYIIYDERIASYGENDAVIFIKEYDEEARQLAEDCFPVELYFKIFGVPEE